MMEHSGYGNTEVSFGFRVLCLDLAVIFVLNVLLSKMAGLKEII